MLNEIEYKYINKKQLSVKRGQGDGGMTVVTAFAVVAIITIMVYKLYKAKTGDVTLPGGFKLKFTS